MIRTLAIALLLLLATACSTRVAISDEPSTFNDPDAPILCPPGSTKRTAANTFRELDPVRMADAPSVPPPGYVPPKMLAPPQVRYPGNLFSREPGFVSLAILIDRESNIGDARVVCSSDPEFEQAALDSVATMSIQPATLDGVPQEEPAIVPIQFAAE